MHSLILTIISSSSILDLSASELNLFWKNIHHGLEVRCMILLWYPELKTNTSQSKGIIPWFLQDFAANMNKMPSCHPCSQNHAMQCPSHPPEESPFSENKRNLCRFKSYILSTHNNCRKNGENYQLNSQNQNVYNCKPYKMKHSSQGLFAWCMYSITQIISYIQRGHEQPCSFVKILTGNLFRSTHAASSPSQKHFSVH